MLLYKIQKRISLSSQNNTFPAAGRARFSLDFSRSFTSRTCDLKIISCNDHLTSSFPIDLLCTTLIHGDLHPPHILINQSEQVTGLLDWTEAKVADPAKDFIFFQMLFGEEETARLLEYYDQAGGRIWAKMQEHISEMQAAYPLEVAKFALQTQQEEHIKMALEALGVKSD